MPGADACRGFLCLKQDFRPRNELDIIVSKSASFATVKRKKIKWQVVVGGSVVETLVHSIYGILGTRAYKRRKYCKASCTHTFVFNCYKPRGALHFCFIRRGGWDFGRKKDLTLHGLRIYQEEINHPQAEQYYTVGST